MDTKKNKDIDLYTPQRQSYVAILIIIYKLTKASIRQSVPAIIVIAVGGSFKKIGLIAIMLMVLAVVLSVFSIISFYQYYFYLKDNKLIVHKGVFKKTVLEIPFDRIQSINNEQNLIHRIFSVIKLNVDTAGSSREEVQLFAIKEEIAQQLRKHILDNKKINYTTNLTPDQGKDLDLISQPKEKIFNLNILQLLKVGITANHLSSFGLIVLFFFSVYEDLKEIGLDIISKSEAFLPVVELIVQSVFLIFFLSILFILFSVIISIVTAILRFYDLTMYRIGDGFIVESGLLNRKQYASKDSKIQILSWSQNFLQKLIGIYTIVMQQATSVGTIKTKDSMAVGLSYSNVENVSRYIFENHYEELKSVDWKTVNSYYAYKLIVRWTLVFIGLISALYNFQLYNIILPGIILYIIILFGCVLKYKKKKYSVSDNILCITGGAYGAQLSMMEVHKVQNIRITQTPFQRRRQLSSLRVHTASTTITIPEVDTEEAYSIKDFLLYNVESSSMPWM